MLASIVIGSLVLGVCLGQLPVHDNTGINPTYPASVYMGCWIDQAARAMPIRLSNDIDNTPAKCAARCAREGYMFAGVQYTNECFCGNGYDRYGKVSDAQCDKPCSGAPNVKCGGTWRQSIYRTNPLLGCFEDRPERALSTRLPNSNSNTPVECANRCAEAGFKYAGVQYSAECFCGNNYTKYEEKNPSNCDKTCPGDSSMKCGGTWYQNIYRTGKYLGCWTDASSRALPNFAGDNTENSPARCSTSCGGYKYAGVQYTRQCFCGNSLGHARVGDNQCNTPCPVDSQQMCGGTWRNSIYRR